MRLSWIARFLAAGVVLFGVTTAAFAVCSSASSPVALDNFDKDPVAWIKANTGKADIGDQVLALAAAATNGKDPAFGAAFTAMLRNASGDDGTAIGKALAGLVSTCSDPSDPGDKADKQYIVSNIEAFLPTNTAANAAFGAQSGQQSASTGSSGGGTSSGTGLGIGAVGNSQQTGGNNSGSAPTGGTTDTATAFEQQPTASAGSTGATTASTSTGGTINSPATVQ